MSSIRRNVTTGTIITWNMELALFPELSQLKGGPGNEVVQEIQFDIDCLELYRIVILLHRARGQCSPGGYMAKMTQGTVWVWNIPDPTTTSLQQRHRHRDHFLRLSKSHQEELLLELRNNYESLPWIAASWDRMCYQGVSWLMNWIRHRSS